MKRGKSQSVVHVQIQRVGAGTSRTDMQPRRDLLHARWAQKSQRAAQKDYVFSIPRCRGLKRLKARQGGERKAAVCSLGICYCNVLIRKQRDSTCPIIYLLKRRFALKEGPEYWDPKVSNVTSTSQRYAFRIAQTPKKIKPYATAYLNHKKELMRTKPAAAHLHPRPSHPDHHHHPHYYHHHTP